MCFTSAYCCLWFEYVREPRHFLETPCHVLWLLICHCGNSAATKVSFTEKTRQGQAVLCRDWPGACVFKDALGVLNDSDRKALVKTEDPVFAANIIDNATFEQTSMCAQHKKRCNVTRSPVDISMFGAPCVDDSSMGTLKTDAGKARKVFER